METVNSVSAAVWRWRDREKNKAAEKAARRRRRMLTQGVVGLGAGAVMFLVGWPRMGTVAVSIGTVVLALGSLIPRAYDALDGAVMFTTRIFGQCLNWLLLAPFFYLCFLPGRLILLARGKDPMARQCPSGNATYWIPRPSRRPDHFKKQY